MALLQLLPRPYCARIITDACFSAKGICTMQQPNKLIKKTRSRWAARTAVSDAFTLYHLIYMVEGFYSCRKSTAATGGRTRTLFLNPEA